MKVGILALQGCVDPHLKHLEKLGLNPVFVRLPADLEGLSGLILPGGESTTMIKLAKHFDLWEPLRRKAKEIPYWGICAGSILMADEVENPSQDSLHVMPLKVRRNAYGRQLESFEAHVVLRDEHTEQAVFIRAPKFVTWGADVEVVGKINGEASFLENKQHMVTAFHPELTDSSWCHEIFLRKMHKHASD